MVENDLGPGDRLPSEGELSATLGSSRIVIREALHALEGVGLLESRPGSGWFIREFSVAVAATTFARSLAFHPAAPLELLAVRRSIEADLVSDLAGHMSAEDLAALDELVDRMRWRAARGERFLVEDAAFHRLIARASGNEVALSLMDLYWAVVEAIAKQGFPAPDPAGAPRMAEVHAALVEALRSGDSDLARHTLRNAHDEESLRRFSAWRVASESGADEAAKRTMRAAAQAAMLWPGPALETRGERSGS